MSSSSASSSSIHFPLILGSSSKWRARIMAEMGLSLSRQMNPDIDEYSIVPDGVALEDRLTKSRPEELSLAVARAKASHLISQLKAEGDAVAATSIEAAAATSSTPPRHLRAPPVGTLDTSFLITSDQVAFFGSQIREKPTSAEQCRTWFREYTQSPVGVCTAIVVTNTYTGRKYEGTVTASQLFSPNTPDSVVDELIAQGDILSCCGGFLVDQPAIIPYLSNRVGTDDEIIGLPKALLMKLLRQVQKDVDESEKERVQIFQQTDDEAEKIGEDVRRSGQQESSSYQNPLTTTTCASPSPVASTTSTHQAVLPRRFSDMNNDERFAEMERKAAELEEYARTHPIGDPPKGKRKINIMSRCIIMIVTILTLLSVHQTVDALPMRFHKHNREPTVMVPSSPMTIPPAHTVKEPMTSIKSPPSPLTSTPPPPQNTFDVIACCLPGHQSWQKNGAGKRVASCTPQLCLDAKKSGLLEMFEWASKLPIDPHSQHHRMQHETYVSLGTLQNENTKLKSSILHKKKKTESKTATAVNNILSHFLLESESAASSSSTSFSSSFYESRDVAWPNGDIPYKWSAQVGPVIAPGQQLVTPADRQRGAIQYAYAAAMAEWQQGTCIQFVPDEAAPNAVELGYVDNGNSRSEIGRTARQVFLVVESSLWGGIPTVRPDAVHELGHVLGLLHTFQRPDRDQHVRVDLSEATGCANARCPSNHPRMVWYMTDPTSLCESLASWSTEDRLNFTSIIHESTHAVPRDALLQLFSTKPTWTHKDVKKVCALASCMIFVDTNYRKYDRSAPLLTPYELTSVMHYKFDDCLKEKPGIVYPNDMSNNHVTQNDLDAVCQLYGCFVRVEAFGEAQRESHPPGQLSRWTYSRQFPPNTLFDDVHRKILMEVIADRNGHYKRFDTASLLASIAGNIRGWDRANNTPTQVVITREMSIGAGPTFDFAFQVPPPAPPAPIILPSPLAASSSSSSSSSLHVAPVPVPSNPFAHVPVLPLNPPAPNQPSPQQSNLPSQHAVHVPRSVASIPSSLQSQPLLVGNTPSPTTQSGSVGSPINRRSSVQLDDSID